MARRRTAPRRRGAKDGPLRISALAFLGAPAGGDWHHDAIERLTEQWSARDLAHFGGSPKLVALAGWALTSQKDERPPRITRTGSYYEVTPAEVPDLVRRGLEELGENIPPDDDAREAAAAIGALPVGEHQA